MGEVLCKYSAISYQLSAVSSTSLTLWVERASCWNWPLAVELASGVERAG
ncbi:MAG: hypothetical protein F6J90_37700 [Moorea sp. SIOASIH]|nr:hypothetical protein [Moorena sp. SIOASIH]NEO41753.1 hypothetical protein [Moorena sp. SIOASIH]